MSFDTEVQKILRREGGYVNDPDDAGGETNHGISKRAYPHLDIANLTAEQAIEIYRKDYWEAADAEAQPEHMRAAIFDAAVNHGPETAKRLARDSGGDLQAFNAGRYAIYSGLVRRDPKQRKFMRGWMNRLAEFGFDASGAAEMVDSAPRSGDAWQGSTGRPVDPDTAWSTSAYDVEAAGAAARGRSGRGVRDTLGEAAVDYIATLRAAAEQEITPVYDHFRGQTAAAAEAVVRSGEGVERGSGISEGHYDDIAARQIEQDALQQDSTLADQYSYLWRENSATGALVASFEEAYTGDKTPDPGLKYIDNMHEWEKGRTSDEIEELRNLGRGRFNRDMMEALIKQQDKRREDAKVLRYVSPARAFGLSLVAGTAGDPLGVLAGFGAYKGFAVLGMGARTALVQGQTARAFAYGGAEAATGELAITGMIDAFGKQQSAGDYAMATGMGFLLGAPFVALDMKGANQQRALEYFQELQKQTSEQAAARIVRFNEAARAELGPDASPDQVASRATELEVEEIRAHAERLYADLPDEDMLSPRGGMSHLAGEGAEEAPAPAAVGTPEPSATGPDRLNLPGSFTVDDFITRVTSGRSVSDRASKIIDRIVSKTEEGQTFTYAELRKAFPKDISALSRELDLTIRQERTGSGAAVRFTEEEADLFDRLYETPMFRGDADAGRTNFVVSDGALGPGVYVTSSREAAQGYGPNVSEFRGDFGTPLIIRMEDVTAAEGNTAAAIARNEAFWKENFHTAGAARSWARQQWEDFAGIGDPEFQQMVRDAGYDSVVLMDGDTVVEANLFAQQRLQRPDTAQAARGDYYRNPEGFMESRELREGITRAEQSGKASDVLRAVVNDTGSPQHLRDLAARLVAMADETDLQYLPTSALEGESATWGGAYFRDGHQLSVRVARPDYIVHEALHGLTSNIIATPKAKLPADLRAKVQRLDDLLAEVRMHYGMNGAPEQFRAMLDDPLGALSDTQELVTYAMTDKTFQQYLASIPSPRSSAETAWQWFKDLVVDLLRLSPGERTALDDVLEASGDLIDAANADLPTTRNLIFDEAERAATMYERANAVAAPADPAAISEKYAPTAILKDRAAVDAMAKKYGLDVGISDPVERAIAAEMYARSEQINAKYPIDEKRLKPLLSMVGWEATSTRMLLSKNPLMRSTAIMLMENPEGAAGRQVTASIIASVRLRAYRDAAEPEYESMYELYAAGQGKGKVGALATPALRVEFDKAVAKEMHARWMQMPPSTDNRAVLGAADAFDRGYAMMGSEMQHVGVLGAARLDVGRKGYFPRVLRGDRVAALTGEERRIVTQLLSDEMQITAGYDRDFADKLAVKYLEMGVDKATKGWNVSLDLRSPDTADTLRDALQALNFTAADIDKHMGRFSRGGAKFTKSRIDLDMLATHDMPDGSTFQLADLFETDMLSMYKNYARRASGEVALSQFGIMGTPGAKMLRKAITSATGEWKGDAKTFNAELESLDQFMAEMLGQPYGTRLGKVADNMRAMTSAAFLGGMGFTQLAESANGIHAVGMAGVMRTLADMPRLLREVRAIGRGEKVENSLLHSIEVFNGTIGSDQYRLVGLRDAGDRPEVYGQDQLGTFSLMARGASHAVRVMSMQRAIEAVQVRGFSEQIVRKAMRFIREGTEDAALRDMGITPDLANALRAEMGNIAQWRGQELVGLDLNKMEDRLAARAFAATVERGASQIIQRTYPGEVGKWAHHDHLLLLTQFRSYPMVATQKQWRRVAFSQGAAKAVGYIIGSASIVLPIYLARTALQGIGKDDEWWEQKLSPIEIARSMTRYTSGLGLMSDVIDAAAPVLGIGSTAGRADVAGSVPALSYINGLGRGIAEKDPQQISRALPGNNLPGVQAGLNWVFSDE